MKKLLLLLLVPQIAFAQAQSMDYGCYFSFQTYQCQEPSSFVWINYGREQNKQLYGLPVAALITQALEDRKLLEWWIAYAQKLHKKLRAKKGY